MNIALYEQAKKLASQPYVERVIQDETVRDRSAFIAETPEIEGCVVRGETYEEALHNLRALRLELIYQLLENHLPVPGPYVAMD